MNGIGSIVRRIGSAASTLLATARAYACDLVESGTDLNGAKRTPAMLTAAASLFEGRPCKVLPKVGADGVPMEDHQGADGAWGREVMNTVGTFRNVRYASEAFDGHGGLVGELVLFDGVRAADELAARLEGIAAAKADPIGLSFSGLGHVDASGHEIIEAVDSVDVVTFPAAAGRIAHRLAASTKGTSIMLTKILAAIAAACPALMEGAPPSIPTEYALGKVLASKMGPTATPEFRAKVAAAFKVDVSKVTASTATDALDQAMGLIDSVKQSLESAAPAPAAAGSAPAPAAAAATPAAPAQASATPAAPVVDQVAAARLAASVATIDLAASRIRLTAACAIAKLPEFATVRLLASYANTVLDDAGALAVARAKATEIDEFRTSTVLTRASVVEEKPERLAASLACLFSKRAKRPEGLDPIRDFQGSLNNFLEKSFGIDVRLCRTGQAGLRKVKAAVDATNFDAAFDDGMNRALLAEYRGEDLAINPWRQLVNITSESDFRTKEVIASTWYDEVPEVAAGAPYELATTPTDRKETYVLAKRGFLETITWESMLNDDLGIWQSMVKRMARAASETLNERVFAKIRRATQPTMADGYKLTSASRTGDVNEVTTALSGDATGWGVLVDAIVAQMQLKGGGGKAKGVKPKFLIVPFAKLKVTAQLIQATSPAAADFPTRVGLDLVKANLPTPVIDLGTGDANDWFLLADPSDAEVIRVGFLGGREDPETFVANGQTFGAMFTNDRIEIKLRHVYGVGAVDYVGIYGSAASA